MKRRHLLAGGALLALPGLPVRAAGPWPNQTLRLVVPFPPGAANDTLGRAIADQLTTRLGQTVVVENRAGAGGAVGSEAVARSAPDGYTLLLGHIGTLAVNPAIYPSLPYNVQKDFAPVAMIALVPNVLVVNPRLPFQDIQGLVTHVRANPGQLRYCSAGNGSAGHIVMLAFLNALKLEMEHVPYRGAGQSFTALIAGETQFTHDIPSLLKPFHESGQARVLFVNGDKRSPLLPDVPAQTELGIPDYKSYSWYGIFGPANLPPEITAKMAAAIEATLADPAMEAKLNELGTPAMRGWSPARFAQYVKEEIDTWVPLVHASGASAG